MPQAAQKKMSVSRTRAEKVADREAVIVKAARKMFSSRGFEKTTMAAIAKAAGVADGTLYLYFANKQALAKAVLDDFYVDFTQTAQEGVNARETVPERIAFLARYHLRILQADWKIFEMVPAIDAQIEPGIESYHGSDIHAMNRAYSGVFDRVAMDGIDQGLIRESLPIWVLRDIFFGGLEYGVRTLLMRQKSGRSETMLGEDSAEVFAQNIEALIFKDAPAAPADLMPIVQKLETAIDKLKARAAP